MNGRAAEKTYSVTQINKYIKALLDEDYILRGVKITGEISNFKLNGAGHMYFTLKDEESALSCVMFAGDAQGLAFLPADGMGASVYGSVSVYHRAGQYQLYAKKIEQMGEGGLRARFEELKSRLAAEGLFDISRKRPLPKEPSRIAVVTSPTGAAVRDIISVIRRRNKSVSIVIFPVVVQGERAPEEIAEALYECNRLKAADTIIVGRGGGSIEDLWAFNEEIVARALYDSKIPVISAVGHETDFTIADYVSDCRAATPSVSAELAAPLLVDKKELLKSVIYSLNGSVRRLIDEKARALDSAMSLLEAVSPLSVLKRGYSLTYGEDGELIKTAAQAKAGGIITTALADGEIVSEVIRVEKKG